jgi:hypothetical protein
VIAMKKFYHLILVLLIGHFTNAQSPISVNQLDLPSANTQVILSNSSALSFGLTNLSATGANSIWNFSSLLSPTGQDTLTFSSPSSTSYLLLNNSFVSTYANKGVFALPAIPNFPTVSDVTNFFKKSSSDLRQVGIGINLSGIPIPTFYNPVDRLYKFPLNYNNVDSSAGKFSIQIPTLGYYGANIKRKNTVDGWGTLTTPYGTFQTLRIKSVINRIDSLKLDTLLPFGFSFPRPTEIEYKWIAKSKKYPLLQVTTNILLGFETIVSIEYQDSARTLGLSKIDEQPNNSITLLTGTEGQFSLKRNGRTKSDVYLFDINGKLVFQKQWQTQQLDESLPKEKGNYIIIIATGNTIQTFKLSNP